MDYGRNIYNANNICSMVLFDKIMIDQTVCMVYKRAYYWVNDPVHDTLNNCPLDVKRKGHIMSNNTVVENVANDSIAKCLDFIKSELACDLDALKSEYAELMAKRDTFNEIVKMQRLVDAGNGWACLRDQLNADLYGAEKFDNETKLRETKRLIALLDEYDSWNDERERLENEIEQNVNPLRELVLAINGLTGDKTVHKTHVPNGDKHGADGKKINHGNMCRVYNAFDKTMITYENPNGDTVEIWKSINNVGRTFLPWSIEKRAYINQNANAVTRALAKRGISVEFVAQTHN